MACSRLNFTFTFTYISYPTHACCMLRPSHSPQFDHPNDICYKALIMNLSIKQYHPSSCSFRARLLPPWSRVLQELTGSRPVKKFPRILWNPMVHYRIHKCLPPVPLSCARLLVPNITLSILLPNRRGTTQTDLSLHVCVCVCVCVKCADCSSTCPHSTKSNARNRLLLL